MGPPPRRRRRDSSAQRSRRARPRWTIDAEVYGTVGKVRRGVGIPDGERPPTPWRLILHEAEWQRPGDRVMTRGGVVQPEHGDGAEDRGHEQHLERG